VDGFGGAPLGMSFIGGLAPLETTISGFTTVSETCCAIGCDVVAVVVVDVAAGGGWEGMRVILINLRGFACSPGVATVGSELEDELEERDTDVDGDAVAAG